MHFLHGLSQIPLRTVSRVLRHFWVVPPKTLNETVILCALVLVKKRTFLEADSVSLIRHMMPAVLSPLEPIAWS
jgi:hypothetical protein